MAIFVYMAMQQWIPFSGDVPDPYDACHSLATPYIHCNACVREFFVDFTNGSMYLPTTSAGFIADQGDILHIVIILKQPVIQFYCATGY